MEKKKLWKKQKILNEIKNYIDDENHNHTRMLCVIFYNSFYMHILDFMCYIVALDAVTNYIEMTPQIVMIFLHEDFCHTQKKYQIGRNYNDDDGGDDGFYAATAHQWTAWGAEVDIAHADRTTNAIPCRELSFAEILSRWFHLVNNKWREHNNHNACASMCLLSTLKQERKKVKHKHGSKCENDYITFLHMFNILIKC